MTLAPWQREYVPSLPPRNCPPPLPVDPGPRTRPRPAAAGTAGAAVVAYAPAAPAPARPPSRPGAGWAPSGLHPAITTQAGRLAAATVTYNAPALPLGRRCAGDINYDPPEWSAGTGLFQSNPDGSIVVFPLSVVEPGCAIGDEGPINEAFIVSPVVHLACGRPFALASRVVVPAGATLYCNRAAIDREMIEAGEGATVHD